MRYVFSWLFILSIPSVVMAAPCDKISNNREAFACLTDIAKRIKAIEEDVRANKSAIQSVKKTAENTDGLVKDAHGAIGEIHRARCWTK